MAMPLPFTMLDTEHSTCPMKWCLPDFSKSKISIYLSVIKGKNEWDCHFIIAASHGCHLEGSFRVSVAQRGHGDASRSPAGIKVVVDLFVPPNLRPPAVLVDAGDD